MRVSPTPKSVAEEGLQKLWFLEEIVADSPGVSSLEREQLGTRDVEDLPSVVPHSSVLGTIRFGQMWPDFILTLDHFGQPVLRKSAKVSSKGLGQESLPRKS